MKPTRMDYIFGRPIPAPKDKLSDKVEKTPEQIADEDDTRRLLREEKRWSFARRNDETVEERRYNE